MADVALGATVYRRTERLADLLDSATDDLVDTVYIADNGDVADRQHLYDRSYPFDLEVLDLEFDSGLGRGREAMVEASSEEYFIVVDSDNTLPGNAHVLVEQLEADPSLGGVGGILAEPERVRSSVFDLHERSGVLYKDTPEPPHRETVAGYPLYRFDQIQNVAAFRRACLDDYSWDPAYKIGWEHTDFFVGHHRRTDWEFGICPAVVFEHNPGGPTDYQNDRNDAARIAESKRYFLEKWDLRQVVRGQVEWIHTGYGYHNPSRTTADLLKSVYLRLPAPVVARLTDVQNRLGY